MIIDEEIPSHPHFQHQEIVIVDEAFDVYFRDVLECIHALFEDPEFALHLVFVPERHYADEDRTVHLFHNMQSRKWWWATQVSKQHLLIIRS